MSDRRMTIPECREELMKIAERLDHHEPFSYEMAAEIRAIVEQMKRRPAVRKTRAKMPKLSDQLRWDIKTYAAQYPDASQVEIGREFNVNPGRVSEALAGKRGE